jgi:hypothetical protein
MRVDDVAGTIWLSLTPGGPLASLEDFVGAVQVALQAGPSTVPSSPQLEPFCPCDLHLKS